MYMYMCVCTGKAGTIRSTNYYYFDAHEETHCCWICVFVYVYMYVCVYTGKDGNYAEYYEVISEMKVVFGWYQPDDFLVFGFRV